MATRHRLNTLVRGFPSPSPRIHSLSVHSIVIGLVHHGEIPVIEHLAFGGEFSGGGLLVSPCSHANLRYSSKRCGMDTGEYTYARVIPLNIGGREGKCTEARIAVA